MTGWGSSAPPSTGGRRGACGRGDVLVVDNASTDGTPALLADLARRHAPLLRVVREPRLGLSVARNLALAEAGGDVVAFLDDDAVPRPGWLAALRAPYADRASCASAPGPPRLPGAASRVARAGAARRVQRLRPRRRAAPPPVGRDVYPYGANIPSAPPRRARRAASARASASPDGSSCCTRDRLCCRLERDGGEIAYAPDAVVDHRVLAERVSPVRILRRYALGGRSAALLILRNRGLARALWRVWWLYARDLVAAPYAPRDPIDPARLARECRRQEALGYVAGLARALPRARALRRDALQPATGTCG
jgi:glycosyltransferase involved in cell wall biosynthesis